MSATIVEVGPIPVELVNVEELSIDQRYQRALKDSFVERIATRWDWRLCGVLHVNERNGRKLVVDGQHRLAAAKIAGVAALPCLLMNETSNEEPRLFVDIQEQRRSVTASERHIALLAARDKNAEAIEAALRTAGCGIATTTNRTNTNNARACYQIADRGGYEHLTDVFNICRKAWPFTNLPASKFLNGLSVFLVSPFNHEPDMTRLSENLSYTTPTAITKKAFENGENSALNVAKAITRIYNSSPDGSRSGRSTLNIAAIDKGLGQRRTQHLAEYREQTAH